MIESNFILLKKIHGMCSNLSVDMNIPFQVSFLLTFEQPAAAKTAQPHPPSGATKSGPKSHLFRRGFGLGFTLLVPFFIGDFTAFLCPFFVSC